MTYIVPDTKYKFSIPDAPYFSMRRNFPYRYKTHDNTYRVLSNQAMRVCMNPTKGALYTYALELEGVLKSGQVH